MESTGTSADNLEPNRNARKVLDGRYELLSEIGQGGMSVVYRARDLTLQREVAVKLLKRSFSNDETQMERFRREVRACAGLEHENIIRVLSSAIDSTGQSYIIMELLQGETLEQILQKKKKLNREQFAQIFMPVLAALEYAHDKKIVHRDLKPSNIMFCSRSAENDKPPDSSDNNSAAQSSTSPFGPGTVKVLDFGIARLLENEIEGSAQTITLGISGTPLYMSPEQISAENVDARSDIYSLACVMYQSITGYPPFAGESALETMYEHLRNSVPKVLELSGSLNISKELIETVIQALSKDKSKRQQSMPEFHQQIARALTSPNLLRKRQKSIFWQIPAGVLLIAVTASAISWRQIRHTDAVIPDKGKNTSPMRGLSGLYSLDRGHALLLEKKWEESAAALNEALKLLPQNDLEKRADAYGSLAVISTEQNRLAEALQYFQKSLDLHAEESVTSRMLVACEMAAILDRQGKFAEADGLFRKHINAVRKKLPGEHSPFMAICLYRYGGMLLAHNRDKDALKVFDESLEEYDALPLQRTPYEAIDASWIEYDLYMRENQRAKAQKTILKTKSDLLHPVADDILSDISSSHLKNIGQLEDLLKARQAFAAGASVRGEKTLSLEMYHSAIELATALGSSRSNKVKAECETALKQLNAAGPADHGQ